MRLVTFSTKGPGPTKYYLTVSKSKISELECSYRKAPNTTAHEIVTCPHGFGYTESPALSPTISKEEKSAIVTETTIKMRKEGKIVLNDISAAAMLRWYACRHKKAAPPISFFAIFSPSLGKCYICYTHSLLCNLYRSLNTNTSGPIFELMRAHDRDAIFLDMLDSNNVSFMHAAESEEVVASHGSKFDRRQEYWFRNFRTIPQLRNLRLINKVENRWRSAPDGRRILSTSTMPEGGDGPECGPGGSGTGSGAAEEAESNEEEEEEGDLAESKEEEGDLAESKEEEGELAESKEEEGELAESKDGGDDSEAAVAAEGAGGAAVTDSRAAYDDCVSSFGIVFKTQLESTRQKNELHQRQRTVQFWRFKSADGLLSYIAQIESPPSSIEIFLDRAQLRKYQKNTKDTILSQILRTQPSTYMPEEVLTLTNPSRHEVEQAVRELKRAEQPAREVAPQNSACPKLVQVKNGNSVFVGSTMNQTVKEMEQRWKSRFSSFKRQVATAKFDRVFHILEMPGDYTIEMIQSFPEGTTTETVKAALKDKIKKLAANRELIVVNNIVGDSKLPTADKPGKYNFYRIFRTDTDECYIGRTTKPMEMRISDHYSKKFLNVYASSVLFRDANFSWELLKECEVASEAEADRIESDYIQEFQPHVVNIIDPITHKRLRPQEQTRAELEEEEAQEETEDDGVEDEEEGEAGGAGAGAGAGGAGAGMA
jgi:hypothetical protein